MRNGKKNKIKDENGNLIEKSWNNWDSSFFPDNWDRKRIQEEVEHAINNHRWFVNNSKQTDWIYWTSKDWSFNIQIQMSEDWKISSFYPISDNNLK